MENNFTLDELEKNKKIEFLNNNFSKAKKDILNIAIDIYGQSILKYCHNILCDYHKAEDITQDVFIKAYKKERSLKREHLYLLGYIE